VHYFAAFKLASRTARNSSPGSQFGISADTPLEQFYREARAFRIYDGPSEVHRFVIARRVLKR